jgi:hypothetical protein
VVFRRSDSTAACRFYVGSYGRNAATTSVSDFDVLYRLPATLYQQYSAYQVYGQSGLLAAVLCMVK